nr:MAG TPA: hypothetical protein [Caudoviricetes sp.]
MRACNTYCNNTYYYRNNTQAKCYPRYPISIFTFFLHIIIRYKPL